MAPSEHPKRLEADLDQAKKVLGESLSEMRELERVPLRNVLYGRSRMNQWPLWVSWLLAPSPDNRRIVRELMQLVTRDVGHQIALRGPCSGSGLRPC